MTFFHIKLGHIHRLVQFNEVLYCSLKSLGQIEKTDETNLTYHLHSKKQHLKTCSKETTPDNETCKTTSIQYRTQWCISVNKMLPAIAVRSAFWTQHAKAMPISVWSFWCFSSFTTGTYQALPSSSWKTHQTTLYYGFPQTLLLFYFRAKVHAWNKSTKTRKHFSVKFQELLSSQTCSCCTLNIRRFLSWSSSLLLL